MKTLHSMGSDCLMLDAWS